MSKKFLSLGLTSLVLFGLLTTNLSAKSKQSAVESEITQSQLEQAQSAILRFAEERDSIEPLGVVVANIHDFSGDEKKALLKCRKMNDRLQVVRVAPNSLGHKLGLKPGDVLMQIEGQYVSKGQNARSVLENQILPKVDWTEDFKVTILRDGYALSLEMPLGEPIVQSSPRANQSI